MAYYEVDENDFPFLSGESLPTRLQKEKLRTLVKKANYLISKEYEKNPDSGNLDDIRDELRLSQGKEFVGKPKISIPRKMTNENARDIINAVEMVFENRYIHGENRFKFKEMVKWKKNHGKEYDTNEKQWENRGFNKTVKNIEKTLGKNLTVDEKNKLDDIFHNVYYKKLREMYHYASDDVMDVVTTMIAESPMVNSKEINAVIKAYVKSNAKEKTSFRAFVDDYIEQRNEKTQQRKK